jgi:hypothetical protein
MTDLGVRPRVRDDARLLAVLAGSACSPASREGGGRVRPAVGREPGQLSCGVGARRRRHRPAFSSVTWWSTRQPGPLGGGLLALAAGTAPRHGAAPGAGPLLTGGGTAVHLVQAVVEVVVALVVVLAFPLRRSTRVWAVVLVLPMWWLAQQVVDGLLHETVIG